MGTEAQEKKVQEKKIKEVLNGLSHGLRTPNEALFY